jgi:hypothetical protein
MPAKCTVLCLAGTKPALRRSHALNMLSAPSSAQSTDRHEEDRAIHYKYTLPFGGACIRAVSSLLSPYAEQQLLGTRLAFRSVALDFRIWPPPSTCETMMQSLEPSVCILKQQRELVTGGWSLTKRLIAPQSQIRQHAHTQPCHHTSGCFRHQRYPHGRTLYRRCLYGRQRPRTLPGCPQPGLQTRLLPS